MAQIIGFHHVSLPAMDVTRSADWFEQTFGFTCILTEEEENHITAVILEHPLGMVIHLYLTAGRHRLEHQPAGAVPALSFMVASKAELLKWEAFLSERGIEHSAVCAAHLGWALGMVGPDGLRIQLHTREELSVGLLDEQAAE